MRSCCCRKASICYEACLRLGIPGPDDRTWSMSETFKLDQGPLVYGCHYETASCLD